MSRPTFSQAGPSSRARRLAAELAQPFLEGRHRVEAAHDQLEDPLARRHAVELGRIALQHRPVEPPTERGTSETRLGSSA